MNKRFNILSIVGLTLLIGLLPSCGGKPTNTNYDETAKLFAADKSISPVIDECHRSFCNKTQRDIWPLYMTEQEAIDSLLDLKVYLVFTTRKLTPNEENIIKSKQHNPRQKPLAYDGMTLIVNNENPDTVITVDNFKKILTGEVRTWKEIYPASKLDTIRLVFDTPQSSSVRFCTDSILKGGKISNAGNVRAVETTNEVIEYVENHKNAIGVVGSIWINDQRDTTNVTFKRNVMVMSVGTTPLNAVKPYQYYLATAEYPFIRTIWAICTDPRGLGTPRRFFNFLTNPGEEGQLVLWRAGLYPAWTEFLERKVVVN
ncbi:MAG: substrate-binding domain-containing protein [Prevotella sp.]|jgi:phosphate transport system substrate-binding protein|nr:substrate-binding domain-containing protein [Prevotella sp.]